MTMNRAFPADRAEDREARRHFPTVWKLIRPYWVTREGVLSALMLACVIGAGWGHTYIGLWLNHWTGTFYDAVGGRRFQVLPVLLLQFLLVSMAAAALTVSTVVLQSIVEIRWRRWLTTWLAEQWLARHTYYRIERDRALENIDQRIAEDAKLFVKDTLLLSMGVLQVPVSIVSFSVVLWSIGHSLDLHVGGHQYSIHGYLVYAVFIYQGLFFLATHLLGRRLITLNAKQNRVEGDFRVLMVRVREFAEQIAFFDGNGAESTRLNGAFRQVVSNLYALLWVNTRVSLFTNLVGQVGSVVPTLLVLPQLMTGGMTLGGLMRSNAAFGSVSSSLAFFPQAYLGFTAWRAEANRLREFLYVYSHEPQAGVALSAAEEGAVAATGLVLRDASGVEITRVPDFSLAPGSRCLVRGPSGSGKSTLLRALAGLWPYGEGAVARCAERAVFVPQRSYIPAGTLKAAIAYPREASVYSDSECAEVLRACGLGAYAGSLLDADRWSDRFSGGEQQRVAFARVLLARPSTIFLDECTSALDPQSEHHLYQLLIDRLPHATVLSVAHRKELLAFHQQTIDFSPKPQAAAWGGPAGPAPSAYPA
ncbi:ABC transporter ATP-binding protein/permease [Burkholderia glumae]|uniref:ABC transporter ATP-binding protein/permease n=1 Tax=Burkholderia glumae TaxID=337 RepID=UPI00137437A9|nr:ABC transporter ATP-binding protein/permease [Burkholderia glumae]QHP94483.1 ABC transporter ATP-binding protein/permease [Burkholderia glumae]QJP70715.1 ABC transporter ATP-binding protein/permease [Burkholderia glumae]UVS84428.1 ABC transporter ATP-binding protein/permease [Burkholderia glumae]UVS98654.1 ABC transporter ATP-binding protein/permease [Burkholderia glumae]